MKFSLTCVFALIAVMTVLFPLGSSAYDNNPYNAAPPPSNNNNQVQQNYQESTAYPEGQSIPNIPPTDTGSGFPAPPPVNEQPREGWQGPQAPQINPEGQAIDPNQQNQQLMQNKLQEWQNLSPQDKQRLADKMKERWATMSPDEKEMYKQKILIQWNAMSQDEQTDMLNRLMQSRYNETPTNVNTNAGASRQG